MASFTPPDSVAASFTAPIGRLAFPGLCLELSTECLVQQRFFQSFQRGELLLVDRFEALGFCEEFVDPSNLTSQFWKRRDGDLESVKALSCEMLNARPAKMLSQSPALVLRI